MIDHVAVAFLLALSALRLSSLLVREDGPFDIFETIRSKIHDFYGEASLFRTFLIRIFECIWCMSVYMTVVSFLLWLVEPWIVILLAAMMIALIADNFTGGS